VGGGGGWGGGGGGGGGGGVGWGGVGGWGGGGGVCIREKVEKAGEKARGGLGGKREGGSSSEIHPCKRARLSPRVGPADHTGCSSEGCSSIPPLPKHA
jgi:hypothetical protein